MSFSQSRSQESLLADWEGGSSSRAMLFPSFGTSKYTVSLSVVVSTVMGTALSSGDISPIFLKRPFSEC